MPGPIDSSNETRRQHDLDLHASTTPTPARPSTPREIDPHAIVTPTEQHWPPVTATSTSTSTSTSNATATATAAKSQTQIALDDYRASFSGPYRVDGHAITAPPQFRMNAGYNQKNADASRAELTAICARAHAPNPSRALQGHPTGPELVAITQALIDAGKLPASPGDLGTRIKAMQWQWGIGIDCTDYVLPAAKRIAGKTDPSIRFDVMQKGQPFPLPSPGCDYFQNADNNPHLARVKIADARPGDVLCLDAPPDEHGHRDGRHRAIIYSHEIADPQKKAALATKYGPELARFAAHGAVHVIEVDSAWGAGKFGGAYGGVRRDVLFFNEETKQWAQINARVAPPNAPVFEPTETGPCDEELHGLYRFR
jgi:hypothetical protein